MAVNDEEVGFFAAIGQQARRSFEGPNQVTYIGESNEEAEKGHFSCDAGERGWLGRAGRKCAGGQDGGDVTRLIGGEKALYASYDLSAECALGGYGEMEVSAVRSHQGDTALGGLVTANFGEWGFGGGEVDDIGWCVSDAQMVVGDEFQDGVAFSRSAFPIVVDDGAFEARRWKGFGQFGERYRAAIEQDLAGSQHADFSGRLRGHIQNFKT